MQERRGRDGEKKKKKKKPIIPSVGWAWRVRSVCAQQSYRYSQEKEKPWISAGLCSQRGCPLHQINRRRRRQPRVPSTLAGVMVLACCAACLWRWRVAFPPVLLRYSPPPPDRLPYLSKLNTVGISYQTPSSSSSSSSSSHRGDTFLSSTMRFQLHPLQATCDCWCVKINK